MRARDLPKLNAPPLPPPCIWRMKNIHTAINKSMGNQEIKTLVKNEGSSRALPDTWTPDLTSSGTIQRSPGEVIRSEENTSVLQSCVYLVYIILFEIYYIFIHYIILI